MITVEELQIILGCDATVAETALDKIIAKVDAFKARVGKSLEATAVKTQQTAERVNKKLSSNTEAATEQSQAHQRASSKSSPATKLTEQWEKATEALKKYTATLEGADSTQQYGAKVEYLSTKLEALKADFNKAFEDGANPTALESLGRKIEAVIKQLDRAKSSYDLFFDADRQYEESLRAYEAAQSKSGNGPSRAAIQDDNQAPYVFNYAQHAKDMQRIQAEMDAMSQDDADSIADKWSAADEALSKYIRDADRVAGIDPAARQRMAIELLTERLQTATLKWQDLFQNPNATDTQIDTARNSVKNLVDKLDAAKVKLEQIENKRIDIKANVDANSIDADNVKRQFGQIEKTSSRTWRNVSGHAQKASKSIEKTIRKTGGKVSGFFVKLGKKIKDTLSKMLIWRTLNAILTGLRDGLQNIARGNEGANKSFSQLATSTLYLKNSLAAALLPALQAIMPIITRIIDAFARAANMVGAFIAALTGKATFVQAVQLQQDYAGSLNGTAEAAEKVHQQLAGFDELNIIQSKSDGGGAYNPATDYGGMFEEVEIPDNILTFAEKIRELFGRIKDAIAELNFSPLIASVNSVLAALSPFADLVRGTLAWGYENVLLPLAKWSIEEAAPASLNLFAAAIRAVTSILNPIIEGLKVLWDEVLQPIVDWLKDRVIAVIDKTREAFDKVSETFEKHGESLKNIISSLSDILSKLWELLEPVLTFVFDMLSAIFGRDIDKFLAQLGLMLDIISGILDVLIGILTLDFDRAAEGVKTIFNGVVEYIKERISTAVEFFQNSLNAVGEFFSNVLSSGRNIVETFYNNIKKTIEGAPVWVRVKVLYPIANFFIGIINGIIKGINWLIDGLNKIQIPMPKWVADLLGVDGGSFGFHIEKIALFDKLHINAFSGGGGGGHSSVAALASGGIAYGDTLVQVGEYANARSNPEVIAPLSKLTSLMGSGNDTRQFVPLFQSTIALLRQIADKETTLNIGGREFGRTVKRCLNEYEQAIGTT